MLLRRPSRPSGLTSAAAKLVAPLDASREPVSANRSRMTGRIAITGHSAPYSVI
jgi:hypothetical protein